MADCFTQGIENQFKLLDKENKQALKRLSEFRTALDDAEDDLEYARRVWEEKMGYIQQAYIVGGRQFLLNWLADRIDDQAWLSDHISALRSVPKTPKAELCVKTAETDNGTIRAIHYQMNSKQHYCFGTDMQAAIDMTHSDAQVFCTLVRDLFKGNVSLSLIKIAFNANERTKWLTKEEVFTLAHGLEFSDIETQEFLMRYFQSSERTENDAAINFRSSDELIHLFTLKYPQFQFSEIRDVYQRAAAGIPKVSPGCEDLHGITEGIASDVQGEDPAGNLSDAERKKRFLYWMVENAQYLDLPSTSGTELVRLLARKILSTLNALSVLEKEGRPEIHCPIPEEPVPLLGIPLASAIGKERRADVLSREQWTDAAWQNASELLLYYLEQLVNHNLSDLTYGRPRVLHDPEVNEGGKWKAENKKDDVVPLQDQATDQERLRLFFSFITPRNADKKRGAAGEWKIESWASSHSDAENHLLAVLSGAVPAQKGDVLLLLLMLCCIIWETSTEVEDTLAEELNTKLSEYWVSASMLLNGEKYPNLAKWYLPHYLEYTIMTSIVLSQLDAEHSAFGWYYHLIKKRYGED